VNDPLYCGLCDSDDHVARNCPAATVIQRSERAAEEIADLDAAWDLPEASR
jgi:hypothetical protein